MTWCSGSVRFRDQKRVSGKKGCTTWQWNSAMSTLWNLRNVIIKCIWVNRPVQTTPASPQHLPQWDCMSLYPKWGGRLETIHLHQADPTRHPETTLWRTQHLFSCPTQPLPTLQVPKGKVHQTGSRIRIHL